ncbi:hypothetical protein GYMLUDRAFT_94693 [Collybiopsis luxurians FD-317 M1]|nr:hypothetical protein GYMLUDRAFT_94693 [Collybiopsis luxurians FD-317 M1]
MSDASKLTVNIAPAAYANDVSISASGSFSIEVDVNQVSNRVHTERLAKARQNAFSYQTNPRNLESPWSDVYRLIIERIVRLNSAVGACTG